MKVALVISALCTVLAAVMAYPQRSPYAPRPVNYPAVLPRFGGEGSTDSNLENRISEAGSNSTVVSVNNDNNDNALQDPYLVSQAQSWPDDHKPFWLINAQHIASHLGQSLSSQSVTQTPPRSPFAKNLNG